jgi:hypothetical protein
MSDELLNRYLDDLRNRGLSSPAGYHWAEFGEWLKNRAGPNAGKVPVPLILAASGESNARKLSRLKEQLVFALRNGFLAEAIEQLEKIDEQQWNRGTPEGWHRTSYGWN